MKKIFLLFLFTCFISFGQNMCPFAYTGTDSNATIAVTQDNSANFMITDGSSTISLSDIECPIEIGVVAFEFDPGVVNPICAGSTAWVNSEILLLQLGAMTQLLLNLMECILVLNLILHFV